MVNPMYEANAVSLVANTDNKVSVGNLGSLLNIKGLKVESEGPIGVEPTKKRRGRPPKKKVIAETGMIENENTVKEESYKDGYEETNNVLKSAIVELDNTSAEIDKDIAAVRTAKTLKNKYDYISSLVGTKCNIIQSKIAAAREINNSTTKAYDLELKKAKEMKLNAEDVSDEKKIMDMYNSMISMPYGNSTPILPVTNTGMYDSNINRIEDTGVDQGYINYQQNLTPEQNFYRHETDPNVKEVVLYDPETGMRKFAFLNMVTKQEVPNMPVMDPGLMDEFTLDTARGIAKSSNLGMSFPIVMMSL